MDYLYYSLIEAIVFPLLVIGLLIFLVGYLIRRRFVSSDPERKLFASREDAVGQLFAYLAFVLVWLAFSGINRQFGEPLEYYTIGGITSVLALIFAYYKKMIFLVPFALLHIGAWWGWALEDWSVTPAGRIRFAVAFAAFTLYYLILYALSFVHKKRFNFHRAYLVYTVLGIMGGTMILFTLSTTTGIMLLQEMTRGVAPFGSWQIMLSLLVAFMVFISTLVYLVQEKYLSLARAGFIGALGVFPLLFLGLPEQQLLASDSDYYYGAQSIFSTFTSAGVAWFFFFNVLLFAEVVALILSGYAEKETWRVNLGTAFLFLFIVIKYFDFFSLLDKSVFFIGAGLILCGMGYFMENGRKKMVAEIHSVVQ